MASTQSTAARALAQSAKGALPMFSYGSTISGLTNHTMLREATGAVFRTAPAILRGASLYAFEDGAYSGMYLTDDASKTLKGEVLVLDEEASSVGSVVPGARWVMGGTGCYDDVLEFCDDMQEYFGEGHPDNVYERRMVEVELVETGETQKVWVYECNMSKEAAHAEIESGDFIQHLMEMVPEKEGARMAHAE